MSEDAPLNPKRALVKRAGKDKRGRFLKGHKMARGRPKGSKNKTTLVREQMERHGTLMLGRMFPHLVKKALDMALDGDKDMLREFLARGMPKTRVEADGVPDRIEIQINNLIATNKKPIEAEVVDAEIEPLTLEHQAEEEDVSVVINTRGRESVHSN